MMNRRLRLLISSVFVALLCSLILSSTVFASIFIPARAAHPASLLHVRGPLQVTCHKQSCNGQSPLFTGCNGDQQQVASVNSPDSLVTITLEFSRTCQTKWASVAYSFPQNEMAILYASVQRKQDKFTVGADVMVKTGENAQMDSGMVYTSGQAQACGSQSTNGSINTPSCTSFA